MADGSAITYASVCAGIEAVSVAVEKLRWQCAFFSEIEPFPCAVLAHHYPHVPNYGDMTRYAEWPDAAFDVLFGGTPCQSFSVAGLREGLADPRGNLMLTFGAIAARYRPDGLVWENVPGVLSSNGGRDFASFLGLLSGQLVKVPIGGWKNSGIVAGIPNAYGLAYRVLDAQFFGVPQRRRRVFVVGCLGDWRRAAAILFERESLSWNPAPRRQARKDVAPTISARTQGGGGLGTDFECDGGLIARPLLGKHNSSHAADQDTYIAHAPSLARCDATREGSSQDFETTTMIAHALRADGFDASKDGTGRGTPLIPVEPITLAIRGRGDSHQLEFRQDGTANAILTPNGGRAGIGVGAVAFDCKAAGDTGFAIGPVAGALRGEGFGGGHAAVAFSENMRGEIVESDVSRALQTQGGKPGQGYSAARVGMQVRRLTPRECERLQGFPDDYTLVPFRKVAASKLDADFLKYQLRGNPKHLTRADLDRLSVDGVRYKALGNSMAVPVMRWICERYQSVRALMENAA